MYSSSKCTLAAIKGPHFLRMSCQRRLKPEGLVVVISFFSKAMEWASESLTMPEGDCIEFWWLDVLFDILQDSGQERIDRKWLILVGGFR